MIELGSFEWKIKLKIDIDDISIGVIEDRNDLLQEHQGHNDYALDGNGCILLNNGSFFYSSDWNKDIDGYCDLFGDAETVITMTLDMDKQSVKYKINDKDYGYIDAKCVKKQQTYRLAVTIGVDSREAAIQLL